MPTQGRITSQIRSSHIIIWSMHIFCSLHDNMLTFNFIHLHNQVDLAGILAIVPLPLSQGVLLSLLQQLSCDIKTDTPRKLAWMTDVAAAINPTDPRIAAHVRRILNEVYRTLGHHRNLSTTSPSEASTIRLLMHVINSVLLSCK